MLPKFSPIDDLEALAEEIDNLVLDRVRSAVPAEVDQRLARLRSSQSAQAEVEAWVSVSTRCDPTLLLGHS